MSERQLQNALYSLAKPEFIRQHPVCPVTGGESCQVHHSAKREGRWINLARYWIAVSLEGHAWIESHKKEAELHGLMVRISGTSSEHIAKLEAQGISLHDPVFYETWDGQPLFKESGFD